MKNKSSADGQMKRVIMTIQFLTAFRTCKKIFNRREIHHEEVKIAVHVLCSTEIGKATSLLELIIYQQNMFRQVSRNQDILSDLTNRRMANLINVVADYYTP